MPRLTALHLVALLGTACAMPGKGLAPAAGAAPAATAPAATAAEPVPTLQLPEGVRPTHAALLLRLDPDADGFSGEVAYDLDLATERSSLWLNGHGLAVTQASLEVAGERIAARYEEVDPVGVARVTPARPVGPGPVRLRLAWAARWSPGLVGLIRTELDGRRYLVTQLESVHARRVFPSFDEPRFKHPWDVTLEVPAGLVAIGNTPPVREEPASGDRHRLVLGTTRPLPSYLLAWAVGPWDVVEAPAPPNQVRATPLPVRGLAPAGRGADLALALRDGNALLAELERWFGTPFPYPKLDHLAAPDFRGGMENAGLIVYGGRYLLHREAETSHLDQADLWDLLAHEMAHQWFGDLVTLPWWTDTWLNESFATWMATEAIAAWRPELQSRRDRLHATDHVMAQDSLAMARAVRQPLLRIEAVEDQFDDLSYAKGAAVIAMFERWLGPERFRAGVRAYLGAHADGSGDAEHLLTALSTAAGREVGAAFHSFLDQPGVPQVTARAVCQGGMAWLELSQRRWLPLGSRAGPGDPWRVPVCARFGVGEIVRERCTLLEAPTGNLDLGEGCPTWVMPNAGGAGYYRSAQPPDQLEALLSSGWPRLAVEERLVAAQDLVASLDAGALPPARALALLGRLARDPDGDVALTALQPAAHLVERVAPPTVREAARRWAASLYAPALARLGLAPRPGEPVADARLRTEAAGFAASVGRDPALRTRLADLGRVWLNPGGQALRPEAVHPDLTSLAGAIAVEDGGAALFDLAARRLDGERDAAVRQRLLQALAAARDPALVARAQAITMSARIPLVELMKVTWSHLEQVDHERAGWDGFRRQADAAAARDPDDARYQPYAGFRLCDPERLAEVRAFFEPRARKLPAMARPLAESLESVELCIASVEAGRAPLAAALAALPPAAP